MSQRKDRLRRELEEARLYLLSVAGQIGPEQALNSTENPAWSVHDILAHLAGAERGLQATIQRFLHDVELPENFSLAYWNQRQVEKAQARSVDDLLAGLAASRKDTWTLLDSLNDEQLDTPGRHPAGLDTNVAGVFLVIALHERDHGREIAAAIGLDPAELVDWSVLRRWPVSNEQ